MDIKLREENAIGGDVPPDMVNWSNLPLDIVEGIIGRLGWRDRCCMRAVCKAWSSVSATHIPSIDKFPWALKRYSVTDHEYQLIYPPLHKQVPPFRREEIQIFHKARAHASSYGWVLFEAVTNPHGLGNFLLNSSTFFLYSPFTSEVITLPESDLPEIHVATFSLDATSPKCVIFGLRKTWKKISIYICSPGDIAWKKYEFGFDLDKPVEHAAYAGGIFYCVFLGGELGAFNLQLKEWTMLTLKGLPDVSFYEARLIASDGDLRVIDHFGTKDLKLLKFDFSKKRWVKENSLNNRVLFIGDTCFSCPAVGELSQLANHVFSCWWWYPHVRCYGTKSDSLQCQNWAQTAESSWIWIEFPSNGIWRANDLMAARLESLALS